MSARYGTLACIMCRRRAPKRGPTQKLCGRPECKRKYGRLWWRAHGRLKRVAQAEKAVLFQEQGVPICPACGERLGKFAYGSDPMTGQSLEFCHHCGERPLQIYGRRTYDQREQLEAEMRAKQERAEAPIDEGARERSKGRTQSIAPLRWGKGLVT